MAGTYTTKSGDVWDKIAYDTLGDGKYTPQLMRANPEHIRTSVFRRGVTLTIPDIPEDENSTAAPWRKDTI